MELKVGETLEIYHYSWDVTDPEEDAKAVEHMRKRAREGNQLAKDFLKMRGEDETRSHR
jgi:hypothetical protein